jgi:UDP-N-acetylmuramoyl-L-alanyl-D-glutamate--2,6-diaminopimelate ligase
MEAYLASKQQLFESHRAHHAVINVGDPAGRATAAMTRLPVTSVAIGRDAHLRADDLRSTPTGTEFTVTSADAVLRADLPLVGSFNVANALIAIGLAVADGVALDDAVAALSTVPSIRGRMEVVPHAGEFTVIVDYAHTPDAIGMVLSAVDQLGLGRRIAVVGAGGDRDAGKRHEMGLRAGSRSDVTFVTNDNPRTEDPVAIARAVQEGALAAGRADVRVVLDRREAIGAAIAEARAGDVVLILGKGHELGQDIGGVVQPFDDREVAQSFLEVSA